MMDSLYWFISLILMDFHGFFLHGFIELIHFIDSDGFSSVFYWWIQWIDSFHKSSSICIGFQWSFISLILIDFHKFSINGLLDWWERKKEWSILRIDLFHGFSWLSIGFLLRDSSNSFISQILIDFHRFSIDGFIGWIHFMDCHRVSYVFNVLLSPKRALFFVLSR